MFQSVCDYLRMLTPVCSQTVTPSISPAGTAYHASAQERKSSSTAVFPFVNFFTKTSSTGGNWVAGKTYFAGALLTVSNEPSTITVDATHYRFWIVIDWSTPASPTAAWYSGEAFPAITDSTMVFRMLDVEFTDGAIVSFACPNTHDIVYEGRFGVAHSTL
jgi:hypothetical protein